VLDVNQALVVDVAMQVGQATEKIVVSSDALHVETASTQLGEVIEGKEMTDVPLVTRSYTDLLALQPGVISSPSGMTGAFAGPFISAGFPAPLVSGDENAGGLSVNGMREASNGFILNGILVQETGYGGAGAIPNLDSIAEFRILTNNFDAEYGNYSGGIVNVVTKSGTNQFHGSGFEFLRNTALDSRNFFSPERSFYRQNQFGGTVGGPIQQNKLFYFGAYEGQRELIGAPNSYLVPTTASLGGNVTSSLTDACNSVAAANRNPLSLTMAGLDANCKVVAPQANLFQSGTSTTIVPIIPLDTQQDNVLAKTDYRINERHNLSAEYYYSNYRGLGTQNQIHDYWRASNEIRSQIAGVHWTSILNPNLVNEARFGMNRVYQFLGTGECAAGVGPDVSYLHTGAQSCGFPNIQIQGFAALGGVSAFPKLQGPDYTFQFLDDVSYTRGKHAFKFGAEFRHMQYHGGTFRYGKGNIQFRSSPGTTALQSFISGTPFRGSLFVGDPVVTITDWGYSGFMQDDWRISSRFTLNLGLRYEFVTPIQEAHNQLANFDPNLGMVQVGKQIDRPYEPQTKNFGPRLGFAWDVTGNGRTILRGGGAIIYALQGFNVLASQQGTTALTTGLNTTPTGALLNGVPGPGNITAGAVTLIGSQLNWSLAGPVFPGGQITCTTAVPCPMLAVDRNFRTPYVTSWNLGIQHALTHSLGLDVSYVGNHGSRMTSMIDINAAALGSGWSGNPASANTAAENASRPYFSKFPYLSNINQLQNGDRSNYNGLQATLTERPAHGLNFTVGYTYSHALDMFGRDWGVNVPIYNPSPKLEYGNSEFDIRHRFTATATYALPEKKWRAQMLEGWQLNSIVNIQGSLPWDLVDQTTDVSGTGEFTDRWNFYGRPSDFSNRGSSPIPWFSGTSNAACLSKATGIGPGAVSSLSKWGCYVVGNSMMLPPALGTLGTMGRNIFRNNGLYLWDLSATKKWKLTERLSVQFRAEFFNLLNFTAYASPAMATTIGAGQHNNPTTTGQFGTSLTTPDVQNANPQVGSGAARSTQLGLKLIF